MARPKNVSRLPVDPMHAVPKGAEDVFFKKDTVREAQRARISTTIGTDDPTGAAGLQPPLDSHVVSLKAVRNSSGVLQVEVVIEFTEVPGATDYDYHTAVFV